MVLKPVDILTTAGGEGDIFGALNSLPGTMIVGEEGKLFVRGGDSYETQTFIDGMQVEQPYYSTMPDIPSRGKFSPWLFSGTVFSSGGYSAEYGQALSSALILKTNDMPSESGSSVSLMSVGVGGSHTRVWDKTSISADLNYYNLYPYYLLVPQNYDWKESPQGIESSLSFRQKINGDGIIKFYGKFDAGNSRLNYPSIDNFNNTQTIGLKNRNLYLNGTFRQILNEKWIINGGSSYSYDKSKTEIDADHVFEDVQVGQGRFTATCLLNDDLKLKSGVFFLHKSYTQEYVDNEVPATYNAGFINNIWAAFSEAEFLLGSKFAVRGGIRGEYASANDRINIAPRITLAFKTGKKSQVSVAYGTFYQNPKDIYLRFNKTLDFEKAVHCIANYQVMKNNRTFRIEAYYKVYKDLVKYDTPGSYLPDVYNNNGKGYARGIDIFWRDNKHGNIDYWIAYSFIDSKRDYIYYPETATPTFVSNHNLRGVAKYFIGKISTQIGLGYAFASGRPYYNPNNAEFLTDRTKHYHNLSLNLSYLTNLWNNFTIIHFSVSNLLGFDNVFGYNYSTTPDDNGIYQAYAVGPEAKRFFFLGVFISL